MNWKSTIALVILAAGVGVWLWKGDTWAPNVGRRATAPADAPAISAFEADFTPDTVTRVEVLPVTGETSVFESYEVPTDEPGKTRKAWKQPGNWPLSTATVSELIDTLANLRTRFQPIALPEDADLAVYGLADAQKPLTVKVTAGGKEYVLKCGEPKAGPGETAFTRSAFVRVNNANEVLKFGPDVMPVLRRPAETYRRRQLFSNVERVNFAGAPSFGPSGMPEPGVPTTVTLPSNAVEEVRITNKSVKILGLTPWASNGSFTLKRTAPTPAPTVTTKGAEPVVQPDRLADVWALDAPVRDRLDPAKLQQVLAALPELWVEDFVPAAQGGYVAEHPFAMARLFAVPVEPFFAAVVRLHPETLADPREELQKSKQSVSVRMKDGSTVTVKFGGTAKVTERDEQVTLPSPPGMPPRTVTRKVPTIYRYAQIEGNPQLFTVPADKLEGLFAKAGDLVEANVARFAVDEVRTITIAAPGKPPIALTRKKGNPKATQEDEKRDRWLIDQKPNPLLADTARVDDLVNRLVSFRGDSSTDLYSTDPKTRGLDPATATTITVVVRENRPDDEPEAPAREYKMYVGAPDFAKGKLPLQLAGWPRITLLDDRIVTGPPGADMGWLTPRLFPDRVSAIFARPAIAYRGRKLLDTADAKLVALTVEGTNGFALKQEKAGDRDVWKLVAPLASDTDPAAVAGLLAQLSNLQATEFLAESTANPAEYGLDKPKFAVRLTFGNNRTYKLEVGSARPGKPGEVFARLDGGNVFGLATTTTDSLAAGPVGLLPLQVWNVPLEKITGVEITRFDTKDDTFTLTKDGTNWKLSGPFTAPVPFLNAQPMLSGLGVLGAAKYEAIAAPDPTKFGFDKPLAKVKLTYTEKTNDAEKIVMKSVTIGGVTPGGFDRYAKLDEPTAPVFVLPVQYLFGVQTSPLTLLDRNLLFLDAAKITKVQIGGDKPENAVALAKDDKGVWKAEGAAFTVDTVAAGQLVSLLAPLPVERLAAFGDAVKWADFGLEKPEFTLTVTVSGDKPLTHKIQLGKPDPLGGRFVRVDDGKAVGVIPAFAVPLLARTKLEFADRTLLTFDPATLTTFARMKGKEELELAPAAAIGWDVVKPAKLKADQPLMDELADALGRLRAEKVVAFGKKEDVFKQYGLEPPEATLTLTVGDKAEQKMLRLGRPVDPAKPDGDRYVAVEGAAPDAAVAVLPGSLTQKLLAAPASFRDRTIVKFVDADKLQLDRGDRKVTFSKVNGNWKVTAPLMADAEQAALDDLVNDLGKLRAADWVAEKPADLKPFGLDRPEATWTVSNGDKVVLTLLIGKTAPDGRIHVSAGTGGMIALLGKEQSAKVLAEYRVRKPWTIDAFQADTVEITRSGKTFAMQKRGAAWVDPAAPGDMIRVPALTELLGGLTALQVERYAVDEKGDPKLFGLETPEVTLMVTFKDGSTRTLAVGGVVGGTADKQRYAKVVDKNRTEVFVLSVADTTRLTRDRAAYVQKK